MSRSTSKRHPLAALVEQPGDRLMLSTMEEDMLVEVISHLVGHDVSLIRKEDKPALGFYRVVPFGPPPTWYNPENRNLGWHPSPVAACFGYYMVFRCWKVAQELPEVGHE